MKVGSCLRLREMQGNNFLLLLLWLHSKFDFQVAKLLLAAANFKPWNKNCGIYASLQVI